MSASEATAKAGAVAAAAPVGRRVRRSLFNSASGLATSAAAYLVIGCFVAPAEYGHAAIILATGGLFTIAVDWCGSVMMRYGPEELARDGTLRRTLATRLVFAVPALALTLPGVPLYLALARGWPAPLLALTVFWLLASAAFGVAQWSAVAAQRFGTLMVANTLVRSTPPLVVLALVAAGQAVTAERLAAATVGGFALGALVLFGALRTLLGLTRPDRALLSAMWRFSLPSLIAAPSLAAMTYVDPLVLQRWVSHADVGRYQLAYLAVTLFGMLGASLNSVLSPELVHHAAQGRADRIERYRCRVQPRMAIGLGLCAFAAALLVAPVARAILPTRWAAAANTAAILTVAGGFMIGVWSYHPLVTVTDSTWALQLASMASAAINVALDLALAPRFGTVGVALANVAAWAVQLVALGLLLHRRVGARRIALVPLVAGAAVVLIILVARANP
jgi:O-antigen/teichoic acid export membrane protein